VVRSFTASGERIKSREERRQEFVLLFCVFWPERQIVKLVGTLMNIARRAPRTGGAFCAWVSVFFFFFFFFFFSKKFLIYSRLGLSLFSTAF
jgi:hypothetical protein